MSSDVVFDESAYWYTVDSAPSKPIHADLDIESEEEDRLRLTPKGESNLNQVEWTRGATEPPSDQSTSRPSLKSDKGKAKMPKIEDLDRNKSMHSLDSGYELGLDVPLMRTLGARKVFTAISEQF